MSDKISGTIVKKFSCFSSYLYLPEETEYLTIYLTDHGDHRLLQTEILENIISINADWIPEDRMEWFAGVWARQLYNATKNGMSLAQKKVHNAYINFVETLEGRR